MRIVKNDHVKIIAGKDKGKTGRVLEVITAKNNVNNGRVIVEGISFVKKHNKVTQGNRGAKEGGIETKEAPIHISNVMLIDKDGNVPVRTGRKKLTPDAKSIRYSKKTGKEI